MKKQSILGMVLVLLLAGCAPSFDEEQEVVQDRKTKRRKQLFRNIKFQMSIIKRFYHLNHQRPAGLSFLT